MQRPPDVPKGAGGVREPLLGNCPGRGSRGNIAIENRGNPRRHLEKHSPFNDKRYFLAGQFFTRQLRVIVTPRVRPSSKPKLARAKLKTATELLLGAGQPADI